MEYVQFVSNTAFEDMLLPIAIVAVFIGAILLITGLINSTENYFSQQDGEEGNRKVKRFGITGAVIAILGVISFAFHVQSINHERDENYLIMEQNISAKYDVDLEGVSVSSHYDEQTGEKQYTAVMGKGKSAVELDVWFSHTAEPFIKVSDSNYHTAQKFLGDIEAKGITVNTETER